MAVRLKEERQKLILQAIQDDGHVTVVALGRSLDVR